MVLDAAVKAEMDLAAGVPSAASAVDLTEADIESAVSMINTRVAKELRTVPPLALMEKNVSSASTVVEEPAQTKKTVKILVSQESQDVTDASLPATPTRAMTRESSLPILPIIPTGSPFASMRSMRSFLSTGRHK